MSKFSNALMAFAAATSPVAIQSANAQTSSRYETSRERVERISDERAQRRADRDIELDQSDRYRDDRDYERDRAYDRNTSDAYERGYETSRRQGQAADERLYRTDRDVIGRCAAGSVGSLNNRVLNSADRAIGKTGRDIADIFGARSGSIIKHQQSDCNARGLSPEQQAYQAGRRQANEEKQTERRINDSISRALGLKGNRLHIKSPF